MFGHHSEKSKEKIRQARIKEWTNGTRIGHKGWKLSSITKEKMRLAHLGKKHSDATRLKMAFALKNEKHPFWKGDKVGYRALHYWIEKQLGKPKKCEHCGLDSLASYKIQWANKSHKYKRDLSDWIRLCVSCHKKYDLQVLGENKLKLASPHEQNKVFV